MTLWRVAWRVLVTVLSLLAGLWSARLGYPYVAWAWGFAAGVWWLNTWGAILEALRLRRLLREIRELEQLRRLARLR